MKKRGFLSHVTNLILAAIVILVILVIMIKFMQGLGGNEFHYGSEMTLERVNEQINKLLDNEDPFAETTTIFSIHPDYAFIAGDKYLVKNRLLQAMSENIPNKYITYSNAELKCKDNSCICIFNKDGKPLCKTFSQELIFIGKEGEDAFNAPYLGAKRLDENGRLMGKVALAKFNLITLYIAKIKIDDDRFGEKTYIYLTPIMQRGSWGLTIEQIRKRIEKFKEEIVIGEYEKNYDVVDCVGNGFYKSKDDECSELYSSETQQNRYYPKTDSQLISLGKISDSYEKQLTKPYCCQVIESDTECTSYLIKDYAKCSTTLSCKDIKYTNPLNNNQYPSTSIGQRGCTGTCCYAYGTKPRLIEFTAAGYCGDGKKNYKETDIDCGGQDCKNCNLNKECETELDCKINLVCEEKRVYDENEVARRILRNDKFVLSCKGDKDYACDELSDCRYGLTCKDKKCSLREEGEKCIKTEDCETGLACRWEKCVDLEKETQEEVYKMHTITLQSEFGQFSASPIYIKMGDSVPENYELLTLDYFEMPKKYEEIEKGELIYSNGKICPKDETCLNELNSCDDGCEEIEYCCQFFDKCMKFNKPTSETTFYEYETNLEGGYFVKLGEGCLPYDQLPKFKSQKPYFTTTTYGALPEIANILYKGDDANKAYAEGDMQQE